MWKYTVCLCVYILFFSLVVISFITSYCDYYINKEKDNSILKKHLFNCIQI